MTKAKPKTNEAPKMSLSQSKMQASHPDNPTGVEKKKCC
jgi:hypothetical protein